MSASLVEQILAQVLVALTGTTTAVTVARNREDPFGADELPAINIVRGPAPHEPFGAGADRVYAGWSLEICVRGTGIETAADALHMEAHAALVADAGLAALGAGLRCTDTDWIADEADQSAGKLTARYQMQTLVRPGDLTRRAR